MVLIFIFLLNVSDAMMKELIVFMQPAPVFHALKESDLSVWYFLKHCCQSKLGKFQIGVWQRISTIVQDMGRFTMFIIRHREVEGLFM
jgi:hypothetical protein